LKNKNSLIFLTSIKPKNLSFIPVDTFEKNIYKRDKKSNNDTLSSVIVNRLKYDFFRFNILYTEDISKGYTVLNLLKKDKNYLT